jgi:hypothetical protein
MTQRRSLIAALMIAAGTLGAAQAAEITLFQHRDFSGEQIILRGPVDNVTSAGFNDKTSSILVSSGRWEVCTAKNFQGHCAVLDPGRYPRLGPEFNDTISSVREVAANQGDRMGAWRREGGGEAVIEFFDQPGFRGQRLGLDRDSTNLTGQGFNDRAASVIVRSGTWQICSAKDFQGECQTLVPGFYASLDPELTDKLSSARQVQGYDERRGRRHRRAAIELFQEPRFDGQRLGTWRDVESLGGTIFNDHVASAVVNRGRWELCPAAGYQGQCVVVGPGRYEHLGELSRTLSSLRRVD